jgi:hypothetical protein
MRYWLAGTLFGVFQYGMMDLRSRRTMDLPVTMIVALWARLVATVVPLPLGGRVTTLILDE